MDKMEIDKMTCWQNVKAFYPKSIKIFVLNLNKKQSTLMSLFLSAADMATKTDFRLLISETDYVFS